jgi:hypothetical protein
MCRLGRFLIAVLAGMTGILPSSAQEQSRELEEGLVAELEAYAVWCGANELFLDRAQAMELILALDPGHAESRRTLGFRRVGKEWVAPTKPKKVRNRSTQAEEESIERRKAIAERLFHRVLPQLGDPDLRTKRVGELEEWVLKLDPDHPGVHERRGEVMRSGEWILRESALALERLPLLEDTVREALERVAEPKDVPATPGDLALGIQPQVVALSNLRILTTGDPEEAVTLARTLDAAREVFRAYIGGEPTYPRGCSVFLLTTEEARTRFLDAHPAVTAEMRASFQSFEGCGIPGTGDWAWWTGDAKKQADGVLRFAFHWFLLSVHSIPLEKAWIHEGLGFYLTWRMNGTRLNWYIDPTTGIDPRKAFAARTMLQDPAVEWLEEARKTLELRDPALKTLFERRSHELTIEDLLVSYALAAYLVEACPGQCHAFLQRLGRTGDAEAAFGEALSIPLDRIPGRLQRWLSERQRLLQPRVPLLAEVELESAWNGLDAQAKARTVALLEEKLARLKTRQMGLLRGLVRGSETESATWPLAQQPVFYDPKVHAPQQPIPRRWLDTENPLAQQVLAEMRPKPSGLEIYQHVVYDWARASIERLASAPDPDGIFRNALHGIPPEFDVARALLLRALDAKHAFDVLAALGHAYTDREGNVYPGLTLYDAWASGRVIEMPDVDALGFVHDVFDDWETWRAPIPNTDHDALYGQIGALFKQARRYRELREALADCFLLPESPVGGEYEALFTNLHALWMQYDENVDSLGRSLPGPDGWAAFLDSWVAECKRPENGAWEKGRRRQAELRRDGEAVVRALGDALREVSAMSAASKGGVRTPR